MAALARLHSRRNRMGLGLFCIDDFAFFPLGLYVDCGVSHPHATAEAERWRLAEDRAYCSQLAQYGDRLGHTVCAALLDLIAHQHTSDLQTA